MDALEDDELPQASQACRVYWNPQADLLKQLAKTSLQSASSKASNTNKRTSKAAGFPSPSRPIRLSQEASIFGSDSSCSTSAASLDTSTSFDGNSSTSSVRSRQSKRRKNGKTQSASLTMDPEALQRFSELAAQLGHKSRPMRPVASTSRLADGPPKVFLPNGTRISPFSRSVSDSAAVLPAKPNPPEFERNRRSSTLPPTDDIFSLPPDPPLEPIIEPLSDPIPEPELDKPDVAMAEPEQETMIEETVIQESQPVIEDEWDNLDTSFDLVLSQVPAAELEAILQPAPKTSLPAPAPIPVIQKPVSAARPIVKAPAKPVSLPKAAPKLNNPASNKKPFAPSLSTNRPPTLPAASQSQYAVSARLSQTLKQGFKKPTFIKPPPPRPVVQKKVVQQEVEDLTTGIDFDADEGDLSF